MALMLKATGVIILGIVTAQLAMELVRIIRGIWSEHRANKLHINELTSEVRRIQGSHASPRKTKGGWEGIRKFRVAKRIAESVDSHSFYLVPHDGRELPPFLPGQYLTFVLRIPGHSKPTIRCYSLSEQPRRDYYRCTIKKIQAPANHPSAPTGLASTYFTDTVREGDILDVKAPRGAFHLGLRCERPIVLVGGGVGITPLLSMLNSVVTSDTDCCVVLFFGVRNGTQHLFKHHLESAKRQHHNLTVVTCYSEPCEGDVAGDDYDIAGRISGSVLRKYLASNNYEFYVCGPGSFMNDMVTELKDWGVPAADIHFETFGPSTVGHTGKTNGAVKREPVSATVSFQRSGKACEWDPDCASLLEFAEANGVEIQSGCRAGNCGTCLTAVKSGTVDYLEDPGSECEPGSCLPCICVPSETITLDA